MPEDLPQFGPWRAVEKLGQGGMSAVWRVRHDGEPGLERAVKVLIDQTPTSVDRFIAEARLLTQIEHPNVLRVHALEADTRPPWIVMELLAGRDLDEELHRGPMEPERAARLIADVANGLAMVHGLGVRHRDIKPANVMVGRDGVGRLIDFGIAREIASSHVTSHGFVVGTAAYLPPEVFDEDSPQQAQDSEVADVYALGQTLCEVLSGQPVYPRQGSGAALLARMMREKLERPHLDPREWRAVVPDDLAEIVIAATAREPKDRVPSAGALEERLRGWLEQRHSFEAAPITRVNPMALPPPPSGKTPAATAPPAATPPSPSPKRRTSLVLSAGLATVLLGGIAALTVLGVAALWWLAPGASPADAATTARISRQIRDQAHLIESCKVAGGTRVHGAVTLDVVIESERAADIDVVRTEAGATAGECVARGLRSMRFDGVDGVAVRIPVQL